MGIAILISDRADFRAKKLSGIKMAITLMRKGSVLQEVVTIFSVHAPNNRMSSARDKH